MARKIKRRKPQTERDQRALDSVKAQRGLDRDAHYAAGGSSAEWRGLHTVQRNKKRYVRPQGRQDWQ